jgi:hypothetical protein
MTEDLKWLINLRSHQLEGWGMLVITSSLGVIFIIFYSWHFLGCDMFSRYRNHSSCAPAWLWERSDKNLVLQQETGSQEHCSYDVQRCSLVYKQLIIWKCPERGISLWTNVSRGKMNTAIICDTVWCNSYDRKEIYFMAQFIAKR